jgi:hypothetical protein
MRSLTEITQILTEHGEELRRRFRVAQLAVFGSYARGEQRRRSDVDILVEFEPGFKTFDNYMECKFFLEALLHHKVDLVLKTALRQEFRERVLAEAAYV